MISLLTIRSIDPGLAAMIAILSVLALAVGLAGWKGIEFSATPAARRKETGVEVRIALAVGCAVAAFIVTRWPVLTVYAAIGGWFIPTLRANKSKRREAIARVDAIAEWIETVRGNVAGYAGLQQALKASAEFAPEPIQPEVRALVARLQHNTIAESVRQFAKDMAHPMADLVAACLILTERNSAGNLPQVLSMTAQTARDNASLLRQVEAGRASTQSQGRLVALITGSVSLLLVLFRREFVESYDSTVGQIALFVICSIYLVSGIAMYRLSRPAEVERVFGRVGADLDVAPCSPSDEPDQAELDSAPKRRISPFRRLTLRGASPCLPQH